MLQVVRMREAVTADALAAAVCTWPSGPSGRGADIHVTLLRTYFGKPMTGKCSRIFSEKLLFAITKYLFLHSQ